MKQFNNLTILAIETSCDDTCIAIIKVSGRKRPCFKILSNIISSQIEVHKKYGGVYPTLAKREHEKNLVPTLLEALKKAKMIKISNFKFQISKPDIDVIAVTVGPGLDPCLWTGINFAKELAKKWDLPIVPVNHIESHILANFVGSNSKLQIPNSKNIFPAVCLVVSGGHTQLILMQDIGKYKILGETRDDAAGECFDKVARILGLGYPGGPIIAKEAEEVRPLENSDDEVVRGRTSLQLPRPMINQKNYDFSFSGLKTAVLYKHKGKKHVKETCREVQQAIIDVLIKKTIKAAKDYRVKTIILGGGVSANKELRKQFIKNCKASLRGVPFGSRKIKNCNFLVPPKNLCTDNAVMTGIAGYFGKPKDCQKIKADANLRIC